MWATRNLNPTPRRGVGPTSIRFWKYKPYRGKSTWLQSLDTPEEEWDAPGQCINVPDNVAKMLGSFLSDLKWEDEPLEVELVVKKK